MLKLRKIAGAGLGAAAALGMISLASGNAFAAAGLVYSAGVVPYATQAITSSTTVSLPGTTTLTSNTLASIPVGVTQIPVTLALPSGATFQQTPTLSCSDAGTGVVATCTASTLTSPVGNNTLQISISNNVTTACTAACIVTVTIGNFTASGLALSTPTTSNLVLKVTGDGVTFLATQSAAFASSASALTAALATPGAPKSTLKIDVGTVSLGKQFVQTGTTSLVGDLGSITFTASATQNDATGAAIFSFSGFPASATMTGNFTNIASAYLTPATATPTTSCTSSAPSGAISGTVTGSSITFANIPLTGSGAGSAQEVCLIANGTGIIGQNVLPPVVTVSASTPNPTSLTTAAGGGLTGALSADPYNGTLFPVLYSGNFAAFPMFIRVVNSGGTAATVTAVVQPDTGTAGVGSVVTNLAAGTNTVVPVSTVITNSGVTLDATSRASISLLSTSTTIGIEQLLVNPGSVLVDFN